MGKASVENNLSVFYFKYIKIYVAFCIIILLFTTIPSTVIAHGPSEVIVKYDFDNQQLEVTITHNVGDPNSHYINKIELYKNSILIDTQEYDNQPTSSTFSYTYDISAEDGDVLKAHAYCNRGGDLSSELTVVGPTQPREKIDITISPSINELNQQTIQKFNIELTSNSQPLTEAIISIKTKYGDIQNQAELTDGNYEFEYRSPDIVIDEQEIINITVSKADYYTTYASLENNHHIPRILLHSLSLSPEVCNGPIPLWQNT